ncbi:MAG: D-alanyl-D-alanine carboxypeptidase/D-alanyl-D-alanine-endopeptidase [candidate division Zixibacteria bacterium]|nr:D-alanyl-D-alanine carboxypeptidase/D-alanyl-D-alanine-endopeptidase [candidate division Zixibacteria bacterium]MCI0596513.1 D-alanyl-D-alanine carboxypeptidase/D-alanyl-D-alanine-endopeptidase [candidate division Zixibacteria bacterium]
MKKLLFAFLFAAGELHAQSFSALADTLFSSAPFRQAKVAAAFYSLSEGVSVYAKNLSVPLIPASNAKLATSAAALHYLKPDFRFETSFLVKKSEAGDSALSVLAIHGTGDPSISGRDRPSPYEILEFWADSLAARGVKKIGRLVLDKRYFEGPDVVDSWPARELTFWYAAQTSALSFEDNCVFLRFYPGRKAGSPARIILEPNFGYLKTINRSRTGPRGSRYTLDEDYRRKPGTNTVTFFGRIPISDTGQADYVSVHEPPMYLAHTTREIWKRKGISVTAPAVYWEKSGLEEDSLKKLFVWRSDSLSNVLKVVNKNSQNFYTEQVLRTLGKEIEGKGSFEAGLEAVNHFLLNAGLSQSDFYLVDGSGLSAKNRFTAAGFIKLLRQMHESPHFSHYYESMAIPGVDKSVKKRKNGDSLAANFRVKTGYISGARTLSGYFKSAGGKLYCFSVLVNGRKLNTRAIDDAVDRLCLSAARLLP